MTLRSSGRTIRLAWTATVAVAILLAARSSYAVATNTYPASGCHELLAPSGSSTIYVSGTTLTSMASTAYIVCPVPKTTSGPGITSGDAITGITVSAGIGTLSCALGVFQADVRQDPSATNVVDKGTLQTAYGYSISLSVPGSAYEGYWQSATKWRYAELYCEVGISTNVYSYTVTENGSAQASNRIVSAAGCTPNAGTGSNYQFYTWPDQGPYNPTDWAGFLEAKHEPSGSYFNASCGTTSTPGNYVQIALGPHVSSTTDLNGCGYSGQPASWQYVPLPPTNTGQSSIEALTFARSTTADLMCEPKNHPADGDGRIYSYRTAADAGFGADVSCSTGIVSGNACCSASCGTCGGSGCSGRPGGASRCCVGNITNAHKYCVDQGPPCIMADPECRTGMLNPTTHVCCPAACGNACGNANCATAPGGAAACCASNITAAGNLCSGSMPPCISN